MTSEPEDPNPLKNIGAGLDTPLVENKVTSAAADGSAPHAPDTTPTDVTKRQDAKVSVDAAGSVNDDPTATEENAEPVNQFGQAVDCNQGGGVLVAMRSTNDDSLHHHEQRSPQKRSPETVNERTNDDEDIERFDEVVASVAPAPADSLAPFDDHRDATGHMVSDGQTDPRPCQGPARIPVRHRRTHAMSFPAPPAFLLFVIVFKKYDDCVRVKVVDSSQTERAIAAIPARLRQLMAAGRTLTDSADCYCLPTGSTVIVHLHPGHTRVLLRLMTGQVAWLWVNIAETIEDLKFRVHFKTNLDLGAFKLEFAGKTLEDGLETTLQACGIITYSTIHVVTHIGRP